MSQLSENYIQDSFHSYLKLSLTQAKAERLLEADVLASAEGDLMITGPALCLYFAALRCTTNPPSVPLPRSGKSGNTQPMELSYENCPPPFVGFLRVWAGAVPPIQALAPEAQHDLARVICGLRPLTSSDDIIPTINGISADLRAVAIEISQRRSFQDRYASDLQAALDAGGNGETPSPRKASFVPPPVYDAIPLGPPASASLKSAAPDSQQHSHGPPLPSPGLLSSFPGSAHSSTASFSHRAASPSVLTQDSPAIEFIRETLYASLADALECKPSLRRLLARDRSRAYFASVAFAVLDIASHAITPDGAGVVGVLGKPLTLAECPPELRPFMVELAAIGLQATAMEDEDNEVAMRLAQDGQDIPLSRLDRVKLILEEGVGYERGLQDSGNGRRSVEGRAVAFANRINALSLGMTKLKAFRERQDEVFKVLSGIGS